jgi:hypothetical protein
MYKQIPIYDARDGKHCFHATQSTLKNIDKKCMVGNNKPVNTKILNKMDLHAGVLINEKNKKVIYFH